MKKVGLALIALLLFSFLSSAQSGVTSLSSKFKKHQIQRMEIDDIWSEMRDEHEELVLNLNGKSYHLALEQSNILADNYKLVAHSDKGKEVMPRTQALPYNGYVVGRSDTRVSLTFNKGFIYGFVRIGNQTINIEPLRHYLPDAGRDQFITFLSSDVIDGEYKCGAERRHEVAAEVEVHEHGSSRMGECLEVEWAIASDFQMYLDMNSSVFDTEDHNIGVANDVQTNYDDEFADEIQFLIVEQQIFTTSESDPFTSSNEAETVLDSFTAWGPTGFDEFHDVGSLWTGRNFNGGTIGIAWLNAICTSIRYNALENFTSNAGTKRVMVSHELGHNFSATHDPSGSPTIMAPSVNLTNNWSSQSINQIQNFYSSIGCLGACSSATAPEASFEHEVLDPCAPGEVQFTDTSEGNPSSYSWFFEGGSPASSTQANPIVTYSQPGTYDVTLEVSNNAGSDELTLANEITILGEPLASFTNSNNQYTVFFENESEGGDSYFWDFGDGQGFSDLANPNYEYEANGTYTVSLTVSNQCGADVFTMDIEVVADAVAEYSGSVLEGCEPLTVQFFNDSENATDYQWSFAGGTPATSTEAQPTVVFNDPGQYTVTLVASNSQSEDVEERVNYITVNPNASSNFSYTVDGATVSFTNSSEDADGYFWNFGDGNTSGDMNPMHTYSESGDYTVVLTAFSDCLNSDYQEVVTISLEPVAAFEVPNPNICPGQSIEFVDQSTFNPTSWQWTFPGGTPATSTEQNPTVTYDAPGIYDVTLLVSNDQGMSTITQEGIVNVQDLPTSQFGYTENGLTLTFTNDSNFADASSWSFGDGSSSMETNPTHTYDEEGIYTVSLITVNSCGEAESSMNINLYTLPTGNFAYSGSQCVGNTIQFDSGASSNTVSFAWTFEGGTPATSSEMHPTVTYAEAGTFEISLVLTNPAGSETLTQSIDIGEAPTASYTSTSDQMTTMFTNTSTGGDTYAWDFGDGNTSTEQNPTHTYSMEGMFEVTLNVTNECGQSDFTQSISAYAVPTAGASASTNAICQGNTVSFQDESSANVTSWNWTFEGGTPATSTEQNPTVSYLNPGIYNVTLSVTAPGGMDQVEYNDLISVAANPVASFVAVNNMQTVTFTNNSTYANSSAWDFGDGNTSAEDAPTHTYNQEGDYTVSLTVTNDCGTNTYTETISVNSLPSANASADQREICEGDQVMFTDLSSDNVTSWLWTFEGGTPATSTEANPTVTYNDAGSYQVNLVVSAPAGTDELILMDHITVGALPDGDFTAVNNMQTVTFTNNVTGADSFMWNFGDGNTSTMTNPVHTYDVEGEYNVTLIATNTCGDLMQSQTVSANALPTASGLASATIICQGDEVSFTDQSSDNVTTWLWEFEGGTPATSTDKDPVVMYEQAGQYDVKLTVTAAAGSDEIVYTDLITVAPDVTSDFDVAGSELDYSFIYTGEYATSWFWDFGDGNTSNEMNPVHSYTEYEEYTVSLTAVNDCGEAITQQQVNVVNSTNEIAALSELEVYPVPARDLLNVSAILGSAIDIEVNLTTLQGQKVYSQKWSPNGKAQTSIDVSDLASGTYILSLVHEDSANYVKVVIQK